MPGEKQNKLKEKLQGMNRIPEGFRFDQEQAWQRLSGQVYKSKGGKKIWWYAAALVFILLTTGLFFSNSHHPEMITRINAPETPEVKAVQEGTMKSAAEAVTYSKKPVDVKQKRPIIKPKEVQVSDMDSLPVSMPELVTNTVTNKQEDSLVRISTASTTTKPRFKIAHINELYSPAPVTLPVNAKMGMAIMGRKQFSNEAEALPVVDPILIPKKQKTFFSSLISSSQ